MKMKADGATLALALALSRSDSLWRRAKN